MTYTLDVHDLENQVVEVRQFEHNTTGVRAVFTAEDIHEDIIDLVPCLLLSFGEKITGENGLSYIVTNEEAGILWDVHEEYTQKPGTFFAQYAFLTVDGTIKAYTEKFIFRVLPSVDIQKAAFECKPRFVEAFKNEMEQKIADSVPSKVSDLENDSGYITSDTLAEYAKKEEIDTSLQEYAKTEDLTEALGAYSTTQEMNEALSEYAKPADIKTSINEYKTSIKPTSVFSAKLPTSATATSLSNAVLTPDTNSVYTSVFYLNKKSGGNSFSLKEFTIVITSPTPAKAAANVEVYVNASGTTNLSTATKLCKIENAFVYNNEYITYIHCKFHNNTCRLTYTKYSSPSSTKPAETETFILNARLTSATSFYIRFIPTDTSTSVNFTSGTKIEIIGNV